MPPIWDPSQVEGDMTRPFLDRVDQPLSVLTVFVMACLGEPTRKGP